MPTPAPRRIEAAVLALLEERGNATACPSEIARRLAPATWRPLMQPVRDAAARLQARGLIDAFQLLQMGWTRARRYANHPGGRKYRPGTRIELPRREDPVKAEAAAIFRDHLDRALADARYQALRARHRALAS